MTKKALVTGASEGIGKSFAERLSQDGYDVTLVARNTNNLNAVAKTLKGPTKVIAADLSTEEGTKKIVSELESTKYDLLINNAGVGTVGGFTAVPMEKQLAMVRLNCEALVALSHAFLKNSKSGDSLINVSSTLAFLPAPTLGLYCATKAFVTSLSESLWYEFKGKGVYVMGLCPGITSTNFQVNAGGRKEDVPQNMAQTPEQLVSYAMKNLAEKSKPTVISGFSNKASAFMTRLMARKSVVSMMGNMMGKSQRK